MLAAQQIRKTILTGIANCGYDKGLLKEDYSFFDGSDDRIVDVVGFSKPTYNSATACIALLNKSRFDQSLHGTNTTYYQSLGCPVFLVYDEHILQFWKNSGNQIVLHEKTETGRLKDFFAKYKADFAPERIERAKTIGRIRKDYQLSFVDLGLMSIIEEKEGKYLSELTERIIKSLKVNCKGIKKDSQFNKWLFQAAFWLIGAKILRDKQVERFRNLKISNVDDLVERVQRHYNAAEILDLSNAAHKRALGKVANEVVEPISSFAHLTTESLAYVYENALVSKETRQVLGTHATPSWLVNYIVWELIDWIEELPQEDRIAFEPACGHAPFLTAAAKLLSFLYEGDEKKRHEYLKQHLIGIEKDCFAEEIARLALTLADIPNPNGWKIKSCDIYDDNILEATSQKARILLCNPPFENFSKAEKQKYGSAVLTGNKAAEVLQKTLPYMRENSVFGIVLPQGFLHRKDLAELRKLILDNFELRTICNLPDNVFAEAGHISTVLLGRKNKHKSKTHYLRICKSNLEEFKNTYRADQEQISKDLFYKAHNYSFRIPELKEIWDYCKKYSEFSAYAEIGRGIEYKNFGNSVQKTKFANSIKGFGKFEKVAGMIPKKTDIKITELPDFYWLSTSPDDIQNPRYGLKHNVPQVIANYARSGGDVWRIKGLLDTKGHSVTKNFLAIRSKPEQHLPLLAIWALINSPFANAYMYCNCMERDNLEGILRKMPVPFESANLSKLQTYTQEYFSHSEQQNVFSLQSENKATEHKKRNLLLAIDAEIMRLYNLPPRLEKMLLDFFAGRPRKGIDFKFDRYYPEGFEPYIPLHIYISEEFQNSTLEKVKKWVDKNSTPEIVEAFKTATKISKEQK